ncbi:MAG TPA: HD-GYP domain-containing protein, partial [Actinomycetota bacterium]|nr:HD-GYP domain-containing protein [Actinomycetota bacterium]
SEARDPYTAGHQNRVGLISRAIAQELGLSEDLIEGIELTANIHDIGKIGIPAEILSRPGQLLPAEFELVKGHSRGGYEIMSGIDFPWPVAEMILQHHERMDGTGYPNGLRGDEILIGARIIAVADVVEAMSSHRPYRASLGAQEAFDEIIRGRGTEFHPEVVDACLRLYSEGRLGVEL